MDPWESGARVCVVGSGGGGVCIVGSDDGVYIVGSEREVCVVGLSTILLWIRSTVTKYTLQS